jgi:hypothetical protein
MTEINHNKRFSEVLSDAKCPRCKSSDKEVTISDANIVGTNVLKAGVQVWQKKINHRLSFLNNHRLGLWPVR